VSIPNFFALGKGKANAFVANNRSRVPGFCDHVSLHRANPHVIDHLGRWNDDDPKLLGWINPNSGR
jgi:hypothetical protein